MQALLDDPRWNDPLPGEPTAEWESVGALRVSYVLPDAALTVVDAGVLAPSQGAGPHRLVWVDFQH